MSMYCSTKKNAPEQPLLRPSLEELSVAPALGVLAALDATLATVGYQLHAEHPSLSLEALARGKLPTAEARAAILLFVLCADLRSALRDYNAVIIGSNFDEDEDQLNLPF